MADQGALEALLTDQVHQIQSGQVIVDLCSVAKELVENSIDAGATSIDVRFKNQGLDAIEVQDNGSGISSSNYASLALKHYTSKLSSYHDLLTLQTFGFRGEALSSLCALSNFTVVTCTQEEAPKATKLQFATSGKLEGTSVVPAHKGTTVIVEDLFHNLPVRRRELQRNIKREWAKVVSLLNQYACVQTGVKFTVSQQPNKGKKMILFSTKGNPTTRDNIINVFGVKTMSALITLDLKLELEPTNGHRRMVDGAEKTEIHVRGHVSRPVHGEGRQTPDRQMFYVNGRPCGLPQFAKVFNEVYRSYNSSQSPFIFADIQLDTHLYDVNVSPDKRSIMLHDQGRMLDHMRESLIELFEVQDITIPVGQHSTQKQTCLKYSALEAPAMETPTRAKSGVDSSRHQVVSSPPSHQLSKDVETDTSDRDSSEEGDADERQGNDKLRIKRTMKPKKSKLSSTRVSDTQASTLLTRWVQRSSTGRETSDAQQKQGLGPGEEASGEKSRPVLSDRHRKAGDEVDEDIEDDEEALRDAEMSEAYSKGPTPPEAPVPAIQPPSRPAQPTFTSPVRPAKRPTQDVATITIGDHTMTSVSIGHAAKRPRLAGSSQAGSVSSMIKNSALRSLAVPSFGQSLSQMFSASASGQAAESSLQVTSKLVHVPVDQEDEEVVEEKEDEEEEEEASLFVTQYEKMDESSEAEQEHVERHVPDDNTGNDENRSLDEQQNQDARENSEDTPQDADDPPESPSPGEDALDQDYGDEEKKKAQEEQKVKQLIAEAEAAASGPTEESEKHTRMLIRGTKKDSTLNLTQRLRIDENTIRQQTLRWRQQIDASATACIGDVQANAIEAKDAEERLALKITKSDFGKMRIVGQFNLGFILAVRRAGPRTADGADDEELFIIDQHASDEKFNFERLQATTVVQSQRLVQPKALELTAVEEEIVMENLAALERNGFVVRVDDTQPVGSRCQLVSLPLSRETTFSVADLEELIVLLGESPTGSSSGATATVPRPAKVRRMLAMRACRSSIMIGTALSRRKMQAVVRHMGDMEKPWNCPHGRPTMRHLVGLGSAWDGRGWREDGRGNA